MKRWLLLLTVLFLQACILAPPIYFAEEIHAQVIDESTGKPLGKVIVVAQWEAEGVGLGDTPPNERLRIYETVTDENGFFIIPLATMTRPLSHRLIDHDPDFFLYKQGYMPRVIGNNIEHDRMTRSSEWHGEQIKLSHLEKWDIPLDVEAQIFSSFSSSIVIRATKPKDWKNYPRMALALYEEKQRLLKKGAGPVLMPFVEDINSLSLEDKGFLEEFRHDF